jgi:hypothetical protein
MKTSNPYLVLCSVILATLCSVLQDAAEDHKPACDRQLYRAPDSRLQPRIVGLLPKADQPVVGFEIVHDRPLVAFSHLLVGFEEKGLAELPVTQVLKGLSYEKNSGVLLQSDSGFLRLGNQGLEPASRLNALVHGRIYGSGNAVFVEVRARQGILQFIARKNDGTAFPIAAIKGPLRAASWNEWGLAIVVGDSLYLWQPGAKNIVRLLTDRGLVATRDVVAVGENRAVVALKATIALVSSETITIVVSLPSARCRFQNGVLYVLQESTGLIWTFEGLEKLGTKEADKAFARDLLRQVENSPDKEGAQFREAARILGCEGVGAKK